MASPCGHCGDVHDEALQACPRTGLLRSAPGPCGTQIDRYRVESLLGAGGFGSVYRAQHVHTHQAVALKLLRRDLAAEPQMLERLFLEARAAAAVDDPRIVKVSDCGVAATGDAFIAMELLEGFDLRELAKQAGALTQRRVVEVMVEVLEALQAAHEKGVVHRDLKPANVFLAHEAMAKSGSRESGGDVPSGQGARAEPSRERVKLLDFGISKVRGHDSTSGLTRSNVAMGTPSYMAPEQMKSARDVDARADVYSVAAMAYELLSGEPPFFGAGYEDVVVKVLTSTARPLRELNPRLPTALCAAIDRGLSKEAKDRWPDARSFAAAMKAALHDTPALPLARDAHAPLDATVPSPRPRPSPALDPMPVRTTATPSTPSPLPPPKPAGGSGLALGLVLGAVIALAAGGLGVWATRPPPTVAALPAAPVPSPVSPALAAPAQPQVAAPAPTPVAPPPGQAIVEPPRPPAPVAPAPGPAIVEPPRPTAPKVAVVQPPPSRAHGAVEIHEPNLVGQMDYAAVKALLDGARDSLDACRPAKTVTVHVHLHTHGEGVALARDDPNQEDPDPEASRCVANRLKAAAQGWKSGGSGIVAVSVTLQAR